MNDKEEKSITDYPNSMPYDREKMIIKQMEKYICHIKVNKNKGSAFFTKIPFPDKNNLMPVLVTNNHILNENSLLKPAEKIIIYIKEENRNRLLDLNNRIKYTNKDLDITFIEIKPEKDKIRNFLELDENILNNGINAGYINESVYIIHYPLDELSVSHGIINGIEVDDGNNFRHLCSTDDGSSGSPVLLSKNNKIVGIHKSSNKTFNYNNGVFLNNAINDFIKQKYYSIKINEFNDKYNLNIKDYKIKEINIPLSNIGNEGLELICKIGFKDLKKLILEKNNITNINALEKSQFLKLEKLKLNSNKISDINVLQKIKFEKLEYLNLGGNEISDINILEKVNFPLLKKLMLNNNKISDINVLSKAKFEKLLELYLNSNNITDISVFQGVNFKGLKLLDLSQNHIENADLLFHIFENLVVLNLDNNNLNHSKNSTNI